MSGSNPILFVTSAHPGGRGIVGAGEGICESSLRGLVGSGHSVHVICFAPPGQSANPSVVGLCTSYRTVPHSSGKAIFGILANLRRGSLFAPWFFTRVSPQNVAIVREALHAMAGASVWIDFPSSLGFAGLLDATESDYFVHDVVTQKVSRRQLLSIFRSTVAAIEGRLIGLVSRCHVLSEKDRDILREIGITKEIVVTPPQQLKVGEVHGAVPISMVLKEFEGGRNLVFFGNMRRAENHRSVMHFLLFTFPSIRRACPDVRFWILGLGPRRSLLLAARWLKGVKVVGAVDDPAPAFAAADLCIAPLRYGAGVKIKVLQILEAGGRVVATPIGAEGINESEKLRIVAEKDFAEVVINAIRMPREQLFSEEVCCNGSKEARTQ